MSLPAKVAPKSATVAGSGPGSGGASPSSQQPLRATLTSVSLPPPPGAPVAPLQQQQQQQPAVATGLPPQIPRVQQSLDERIFSQPGVAAVYNIPRHAGPQYATHDITKGHPSLACTPPGHAHSPALSQVSVAAAPYRYAKGWETATGSPYNPGQNAVSAPLVYSPQTQPMNAQPQSRPFATGPRPTHHQFFQRAQMQAARPTLPANTPSLRPGSQNPTAAVYPPNQPIMMTMAPMPFPSPQAAQYYIPQYRHSTPYVGPPQQYSVQPPGTGAFYPAPSHGDFTTPYHPLRYHAPVSPSLPAPVQTAGPAYYQAQAPGVVFPPSPPIIVPTPQQPPPAKREKKTIRIRDPTQGGRDITEEIMSGGSGSRNPTPPVIGRPSSTPTPPQQQQGSSSSRQTPELQPPPPVLPPQPSQQPPQQQQQPPQQQQQQQPPQQQQQQPPQQQQPQPQQAPSPGVYTLEPQTPLQNQTQNQTQSQTQSLQGPAPRAAAAAAATAATTTTATTTAATTTTATTTAADTKPGPDEMPKVEPALQKSSSPGLAQPDPTPKRREAGSAPVVIAPVSAPVSAPAPPADTPELPSLPALPTPTVAPPSPAAVSLPIAATPATDAGEKPSTVEPSSSSSSSSSPAAPPASCSSSSSSSSPSPAAKESTVPVAPPQSQSPKEPEATPAPPPQTANTDKPLPELPRAPATSPVPVPEALNGPAEPPAEPHAPAQEPSPPAPALLRPQASAPGPAPVQAPVQAPAPASKEVSREPPVSEKRPEVVAAAATSAASPGAHVAPKAPVAVVPVTLSSSSCSSPTPVMPMPAPPPGLPPLVQATAAETPEPSEPVDVKALPLNAGLESHVGLADSKTESPPQALTRKSPTTVVGQTSSSSSSSSSSSATPKSWRTSNDVPIVGEASQKDSREVEPRSVEQPAAAEQTTTTTTTTTTLKPSLLATSTTTTTTTTTAAAATPPTIISSRPAALLPTPSTPPIGYFHVKETFAPAAAVRASSTTTAATTPLLEENGEAEPMRNGAGHASETESSDSSSAPGDKESSGTRDMEGEEGGALSTTHKSKGTVADPAEANGKRQYNRDFLLGFQFMPACVQKPEGLPPISEVVLDKINHNKLPSRAVVEPRVISRGPDFTPAFADFGRPMMGGRGSPMVNMGARRPPPRKIIMTVSEEVKLQKSENAWKPGVKREVASDVPETLQTHDLFRKVRSILNKLTPQMFNQLMKQVTDLTIDTEERLKGVIDLVFEKAVDEPSFSVAYGNMCRCLATLKVTMTDKPNTTVNFRKLLLNRCQKEFEKDKVDDVVFERKQKELDAAATTERGRLQAELAEAKDMARRRSIGNIKFIGELFKLKMLTEAIMHDCVVKLLKNHDQESLECLCRLLTTIGKDLDFAKAKPRMDQYFRQMEKIVKERKTSSRIRFMLQDIVDLRLHDWVSRRADQGPKTIEQIHKEAKIEEQEEQRKVHLQLLNKDTKRRPDPREQRETREPRAPREETWDTVPMTKNSRAIDPNKMMKFSKAQMDETVQLGPQVSWAMGSSGGAKASNSELSRSGGSSLNRFSALQTTAPAAAQSSTPSAQNADYDTRRALGSRSMGRERGDKPLSTASSSSSSSTSSSLTSRPGPFARGGSSKELLEGPEEAQEKEEVAAAVVEPRRPSVTEEKAEPERSRAKESGKSEPAASSSDGPALSEEEMERKSKSIIEEYLHINDYKEALQCVEELRQASRLQVFVRVGVESTLERSPLSRQHTGQLFLRLLQQGLLPKAQLCSGFLDTLEQADDMAIDIPHIWLYLAELLTPVLSEGGFSMRELFSELSKPLLPVGRAGMLFSEILHILCKNMSHSKVGALWRESGLTWSHFLSEGEDVQAFISQQKLQFTMSEGCSPDAATPKSTLAPEELSRQLDRLLLEEMASDEQVFDWVEANLDESQVSSSPFLRALMTAVCKAAVKDESSSCRVDTIVIQRRPVLLKYLNSDTERQLQALYALQALIVTLDQPPNLLRMFFDCLYDEDVISEDAFCRWESSADPAEQQGKGVALKSVTAFFNWLREAEEESEDN